jgi:hypothetical protein
MAAKAACIVCTIDELIDACERRDHLRAFRQNLILGWLKQGNHDQQMELLGAMSVYIVEYGFTDRVVNVPGSRMGEARPRREARPGPRKPNGGGPA